MRNEQLIKDGREQMKRFLAGANGPAVLAYLRSTTIETVMDATEASEATLRAHAAKCSFVKTLESLANEDKPKPEQEAPDDE